jgi:hypothetical protein
MFQNTLILSAIIGFIAWFYFNKFQESEKEYYKLYKRCSEVHLENQKLKNRLKDLQSYKNDVSKTFQILDNELVMINDHISKKQMEQPTQPTQPTQQVQYEGHSNVSMLTPELLRSLFSSMNQETTSHTEEPVMDPVEQPAIVTYELDSSLNLGDNEYDRFLMKERDI